MKPILILQNLTPDGPGYLATWLKREGHRFDVFNTQAGDAYPARIDGYGALAVLGGEMSANDDLPSLRQSERLILQATDAGIPVIGHCLGGQLMARALGARVGRSPAPEIGWQVIRPIPSAAASRWFGEADRSTPGSSAGHDADDLPAELTVYHWHSDTFELPPGAVPLATSDACPHQAFAIGPHLAMQFHVELDAGKLAVWSASTDPGYLEMQREFATVQSGPAMREQAVTALPAQHALADRLYRRWLANAG